MVITKLSALFWPTTVLLGLLLGMMSTVAFSYPTPTDYRGQLKRWSITIDEPVVTYRLVIADGPSAEHQAFTERAAELWTEVEGSYVQLELLQDDDTSKEMITITLTDQFSGNSRSGGFAIFDQWNDAGPVHCQIEIPIKFPMRSGFPRTVLHEFGHCLGLGHSMVAGSVMSYDLKASGFRLATDDLAGASRLYPADGSDPVLPLSCGVVHSRPSFLTGNGPNATSIGTGVLAALHLLVLLFGMSGRKNAGPLQGQRRDN